MEASAILLINGAKKQQKNQKKNQKPKPQEVPQNMQAISRTREQVGLISGAKSGCKETQVIVVRTI